MPNYETHEVHLNQMFFALKQPSDSPGPFNAFKQYLSRDPRFFSLKFMHDTLADVLRGKVDHPVVGDIRLVAQEMGVAGRRKIEQQALDDGWDHVKAEYDIDKAGGLDPMLAYSYFAAKNFGVERIDPLALNLANQHLENPISQGLFALTGPLTAIPAPKEKPEPRLPETVRSSKEKQQVTQAGLEKTIREQIEAAGVDVKTEEILKDLGNLEELKKLENLGTIVSKEIEAAMAKADVKQKSSVDLLEEAIDDDSITPRKLARRVLKVCRRVLVLGERGRLTDEQKLADLIAAGAEKLVRMDSDRYLAGLEQISDALAETLGEEESAQVLTRITGILPIKEQDQESLRKITEAYDRSIRQAAKIGDHKGMLAHLRNKWQLLGFDSDDLSYISDELGKLMKKGRARFALVELQKLGSFYRESDIGLKMRVTSDAFKNLAKAPVKDREHFNSIIEAALNLFDDLISSIDNLGGETSQDLIKSQATADLCASSVTGTVSLMDSYVKRPGKSVEASTAYPLLHEAARPLISLSLKTLKRNGNTKTIKSVKTAIGKMRGDSSLKEAMIHEAKSLFG
jgi:hypothetical protein